MFDLEEKKLNNVKQKYDEIFVPHEKIEDAIFAGIREARNKKKRFQFWTNSLLSAAVIVVVFVIMFRSIIPAEKQTAGMHGMEKIAEVVRNDKGLTAAIAHNYAQKINRSDEHDGIKVVLDSVIADEEQLIMFYHFESKQDINTPLIVDNYYFEKENGKKLKLGYFSTQQSVDFDNGKSPIYQCDMALAENLPTSPLTLTMELKKRTGEDKEKTVKYAAKWKIPFTLDQHKIAKKEVVSLNKTVLVENQKILIKNISFSPTRVAISVHFPAGNTKQIFELQDLRLVNEHGETWPIIMNGLTGTGEGNDKTYYLQSNYFATSQKLYITINKIRALDKEQLLVKVDPQKQKVLQAPMDGKLNKVKSGVRLTFILKEKISFQLFDYYTDFNGKKHEINSFSFSDNLIEFPYDDPIPTKPITIKLRDYPAYIHGNAMIRVK
ncbi:DUF4179 domain-containing protein [Bacillus sp. FJAT-49736]|uniref:DUF4179 domain-containing protein n=1 Tax=Bacillus sp. FJAT-49736 TaxID=2833582 RepID=UPI001BC989CA|nr:DUF4179 domain-containing protein [Bacillus sp. FJAT-49736]MBS4173379.1 DUF4179 domain-containing protein [Bacillus sp. FJAT-49736]